MRSFRVSNVSFLEAHFRMYSIKDDWGIDDVVVAEIERGAYGEREALSWWMTMLKMAPSGSTLLDIGSYTGLYSLIAASMRSDLRTVAIEASVVTYGRLIQNILINGFDMSILPNHLAVSDAAGTVRLGHAYGPLTMASGESLDPTYETDHTELVSAVSLDELILQSPENPFSAIASKSMGALPVNKIAGMKIDVEGVEVDVLKGALSLLAQHKPPLIIEILEEEKLISCDEILNRIGYKRLDRCPGDNYIYFYGDHKEFISRHNEVVSKGSCEFEISCQIDFSL